MMDFAQLLLRVCAARLEALLQNMPREVEAEKRKRQVSETSYPGKALSGGDDRGGRVRHPAAAAPARSTDLQDFV